MKDDHVIKVKKVTKVYRNGSQELVALSDVDLDLAAGEDMAIIGPSGSGKTTLLQIIGGLSQATSGEVGINGQDLNKMNDNELSYFRNKSIGFVFQFFNLQDYLTAKENVMLPMVFADMNTYKASAKAEQLLERVGLAARKDYYPRQLSGGEMQRVAIARSLANDPQLILADEPTANLDKDSAKNVIDLFKEIAEKQGVSVVVITHDPNISALFKRTVHIQNGKLSA